VSTRILIADDDRFLLQNLRILLESHGYEVLSATSGEEAMALAASKPIDLVILDINMPDEDGLTVCRKLRGKWRFPILMLTARTDSMDKVVGLEVGADDYLTKPFEPSELIARIRAHLRRTKEYAEPNGGSKVIAVGDLLLDRDSRTVAMAGRPVELTNKEFELLAHLAANAGRVISRESLFDRVWEFDIEFSSNSLDVHIYRLRKKIEPDPDHPSYLLTVKGYGYKLEHFPAP
jgi:DNA-binding response OmpR family regulator